MSTIAEAPTWTAGIYELEEDDFVQGGVDGVDNVQAKQLANRTAYLKVRADAVDQASVGFGSLDARLDANDTAVAGIATSVAAAATGFASLDARLDASDVARAVVGAEVAAASTGFASLDARLDAGDASRAAVAAEVAAASSGFASLDSRMDTADAVIARSSVITRIVAAANFL